MYSPTSSTGKSKNKRGVVSCPKTAKPRALKLTCGATHLAVGRPTVVHSIARYLSVANVRVRYTQQQDL